MGKKFNFIINLLIILLIIALVAVMMNYYMNTSDIPTSKYNSEKDKTMQYSGDFSNMNTSGDNHLIEIKPIIKDNESINQNSGEISGEISGEVLGSNGSGETIKPPKNEAPSIPSDNSPFIITSEIETSSKEKQEILTEIDRTLTELLEVVDQVQPVDETRLIVDDSEVQE